MITTPSDVEFYEGMWAKTDWSDGSLRNYLVKKERFFLRHLQGRRGLLLDLGCGGGWKVFARPGEAVGIDLSLASLQEARKVYGQAVRGRLTALPFANESFDLVVSSDVLGHLTLGERGVAIGEIWRVLKRGGVTIHYVEAEGTDPLTHWAKGYEELYQKYFVAPEGHIGLESARATIERFRSAGFAPIREEAAYRGLMYAHRFLQLFDNEYRSRSRLLNLAAGLCHIIASAGPLMMVANLLIAALLEIGDRLLPEAWASGAMVCYAKDQA